jgi:tetratricopeptide (TPR) repeat protein
VPDRNPASSRRVAAILALAALACATLASLAAAEWLQPDPSLRDAQWRLSTAIRDTAGQGMNAARLDTLGLALLRLGRFDEAHSVLGRVLALNPGDPTATAGLGKLALFADRLPEAESLLTIAVASGTEPGALADLYAAKLRRGDWKGAIAIAPQVGDEGRVAQLQRIADRGAYRIVSGPDLVRQGFSRTYPVP